MSDFSVPTPTHISTYRTDTTAAGALKGSNATVACNTFTWVANLAIYVPVMIPYPYPVRRVWWQNGSTVTSSNADFGIYTADGTRLYSTGSTAMSGANSVQYVTPGSSFLLAPGSYYFGFACSNTTNRMTGGVPTAVRLRLAGVLQQATALPLPATMTGASVSNALYPFCGITRTASGF